MDENSVEILSVLVLVITLFVIAVFSRRRKAPFALRPIRAFDNLGGLVGRSIESDRPLHISLGSAGLGGDSTIVALASAEMAYYIAHQAAIGDNSPLITLSSSSAIPLGQDTLRRAYKSSGFQDRFSPLAVRWYPAGRRSLAFAAALTALMRDENTSSNVLVGSYGAEIALPLITANRLGQPVIANSDQPEGQAIAFALGDTPLIGEEVFAAAAYLDDDPNQSTRMVVQDVLRWGLVLAMLGGLIATIGG